MDLRANASAAVAVVLLGASVASVRVAVQDVPPLSLALLRFGLGGLLLIGVLLLFMPRHLRVGCRDLPLVQRRGRAFVTGTRLAGREALRACLIHPDTTNDDLTVLLQEVRGAGGAQR